jgi:hypothetical protein
MPAPPRRRLVAALSSRGYNFQALIALDISHVAHVRRGKVHPLSGFVAYTECLLSEVFALFQHLSIGQRDGACVFWLALLAAPQAAVRAIR